MKTEILSRIFVVGCPRSGTTLLQSLLAANSNIHSFPESHFYEKLFSARPLFLTLGISSRHARQSWNLFLEEIIHPEMKSTLPKFAIFESQFSNAFIQVLDMLAMKQGKSVWIEKTPGHLRSIERMERVVRNARYVHIIRNGEDNIASLFEIGKQYPDTWGKWYGTLDQCIQRWVKDARISAKCSIRNNHYVISYEKLVASLVSELTALCSFIGVPFEEKMLTDYPQVSKQLILEAERWKASVSEPIKLASKRKFFEFLNEEQRQYIIANIPEDLTEYTSTKKQWAMM